MCCCKLDLHRFNYSIGIHPWKINEARLSTYIDFIERYAAFDCVKAIGECGLDKLCNTPWSAQLRAFVAQIKISETLKKPLIIHCVKAYDELIALKKEMAPCQAWIIHGFRGKPEQMKQLVNRPGLYLSFCPKFNKKTFQLTPLDRVFVETDDSKCTIEEVYKNGCSLLSIPEKSFMQIIEKNYNTLFS